MSNNNNNCGEKPSVVAGALSRRRLQQEGEEEQEQEEGRDLQLATAMAEKAYAEEARRLAKRQIEAAEREFGNAKRIRQQAQAELERAVAFKDQATKKINATVLEITCHACKEKFRASRTTPTTTTISATTTAQRDDNNSMAISYVSSALTVGEVQKGDRDIVHPKFALC